ncbi:class I SAM-dependent methyltransferase [Desulfomicrobium norvegicum]|uniref:class I SAM-dependent methyltransferase n=1 Tax=Desulfomicrobium norvegicum (strain DSM 1741 / NCIMB 8310) TaxID=52561 RepID=UPI00137A9167|nr:class I SAM-dependent methyltransferase [Desulfomicrobium norvegicum]
MEQRKIWDHFQTDHFAKNLFAGAFPRYKAISREVASGDRVLNIGVGYGGLEEMLLSMQGVIVYSLDPSDGAIALLREAHCIGDRAVVGFSQDIPWSHSFFDVVVMSEVLEHLDVDDYRKTLYEVFRVLRPGGKFVFTVPAEENIQENFVVCPCCGVKFHRWGHVQSFTDHRIRSDILPLFNFMHLLRRNFSDWRLLNWKGKALWLMKRFLRAAGVKGAGETFFVVAQKPL